MAVLATNRHLEPTMKIILPLLLLTFPFIGIVSVDTVAKGIAAETKDRPVKVLIVTGQDYPGHKWKQTAPVLKDLISEDKRLEVTVNEDPKVLASDAMKRYDVIVIHFMDWKQPDPGEKSRANLKEAVEGGAGMVVVHFGCGAFQEWPEFRNLAGRSWDPKLRGHDPHGAFRVEITEVDHPITKGMKSFETTDELYTCLAGDRPIEVLAKSASKVDKKDYPMAFVFNYGKGRVFHCVLGHDVKAFEAQGVKDLFRRGTAWAGRLEPK